MTTRATTSQRYSGHPHQSPRYSSDVPLPTRGSSHPANVLQSEQAATNANLSKQTYPLHNHAQASSSPNPQSAPPNPINHNQEEKKGFVGHLLDILTCRACS
ncbi:hypothetical protein K493DRAFT_48399 [Basidiobolus meristosporus CBS 931.73]|uniref:Uncharacterized protein n=1 Tax=Basidiobolus meristosporus CBS 931.73 TaxID=1314790 RepID=A0A1Y1Y210_9FUNG|nr:hypothetical protein K493DRAFT_48399 [Basidiobolus meristosporus CBS 931.73]|eukprot:ORX91766.1 hypothetical protein K493DRAFT_48399 [Basidiobolus meristosporus CBS 931.73]